MCSSDLTDPKIQSYGGLKPHYSPWRVDLLASRAQLGVTRLWRVGGELRARNTGCSRPFSPFSSKNFNYKFPRSNLILKTYLIILIYIKVLKTIYNTSQNNILKIKILSGQLVMASGVARLASDQGLLDMASWVARLASDEGLLATASCLARLGER